VTKSERDRLRQQIDTATRARLAASAPPARANGWGNGKRRGYWVEYYDANRDRILARRRERKQAA
jgi:hypothetical protein